ncbi:MAG: carbohydrate binding domain-containing protein [Candidatus Korobacteraceae bacterium]
MELSLKSPASKIGFAVVCALLAVVFEVCSVRQCLAYREYTQLTVPALQKATRLDPLNSQYAHMLGRIYLYQEQDFAAARTAMAHATALNPYDARYWLDLASIAQVTGDSQAEEADLERAQRVEPTMPDTSWEVANFYLLRGNLPMAFRNFATVEQYSPQLRKQAVRASWRAQPNIDLLLQYVPHTVEALSAVLNVMYEQQKFPEAAKVWQALVALKQPVGADYVLAYLGTLLSHEHRLSDQAQQVWKDFLTTNPEMAEYVAPNNLVVNGGFEHDVLDGGFDWHHAEHPYVKLAQESAISHSGSRSLSVSFDGNGIQDFGIFQYVPVKPNSRYRLQAYVRADNILGSSGPRLAVTDPYDASHRFYTGDDILGSSLWSAQTGSFSTGPDTHMVAIALLRDPPYDPIHGHLWLDDVSITPEDDQ